MWRKRKLRVTPYCWWFFMGQSVVLWYTYMDLVKLRSWTNFRITSLWRLDTTDLLLSLCIQTHYCYCFTIITWAASSELVSSSIPSWQILTVHAQPFRGARDLIFCLKVPLDSLLVWASSEGSGETARMRRLAWTFAARTGYKYQIRFTRST